MALVSCTALQVHTRLCYDAGRRLVEQVVVHLASGTESNRHLLPIGPAPSLKRTIGQGAPPRPCGTPIVPTFGCRGICHRCT